MRFMRFLTVFALAIRATSQQTADFADIDCNHIPPALWCADAHLGKKCGFTSLCDVFESGSKNEKISLTLLYESLCPHSRQFIVEHLYPLSLGQFRNFVNIELVPYGLAKVKNGVLECHHGENECELNKYQSCAIKYLTDEPGSLPYIACLEQAWKDVPAAIVKCFNAYNYSSTALLQNILDCSSQQMGNVLQLAHARRTESAFHKKNAKVPWLLVNNVSVDAVQYFTFNSLPAAICSWYTGDAVPAPCQQILDEI